jgi:hypothetical protein
VVDPSRHAQKKNWLESIAQSIPGFSGYLDREDRREGDALTRKWLEDRLQQSKRGLDERLRSLLDAGQLDALPAWERVRSRLDGFMNKIRSAERGYSGFFDFVKVTEDELDQVYQLDSGLVADVRAWAELVEQPGEATAQAAADLLRKLEVIEANFGKRGDILRGIGPDA